MATFHLAGNQIGGADENPVPLGVGLLRIVRINGDTQTKVEEQAPERAGAFGLNWP